MPFIRTTKVVLCMELTGSLFYFSAVEDKRPAVYRITNWTELRTAGAYEVRVNCQVRLRTCINFRDHTIRKAM